MSTSTKEQRAEYNRRYRERHPERVAAASKRWRDAHPEKGREYAKRHRERHPAEAAARVEGWKARHPERVAEHTKQFHERNPEKKAEYDEGYAARNPEKKRAQSQLTSAVHSGRIAKPLKCERCGYEAEKAREIHGHHHDYDKPLDVEWLCWRCHRQEHCS